MKVLKFGFHSINVPESWKDCSKEQIIEALPIQLSLQESGHDAQAAIVYLGQLAKVLTGVESEDLFTEHKMELYRAVNWAVTEKITHKPFNFLSVNGLRFYLPEEGFYNTSAIELSMANVWYLLYAHPEKPQWKAVFQLLATICRPRRLNYLIRKMQANYNGDDRVTFNSVKADQAAKLFEEHLPLGAVMAVLQYWENMNNAFVEQNKALFEGSDGKALFTNGEGWLAMLEDVAKEGVHGDFDKVADTNCHTVWMYMKHRKLVFDEQARVASLQD